MNYKENNSLKHSLNDAEELKIERMRILTDMFPLIPQNYFYPLIKLSEEELGNVIMELLNKNDNLDIMVYLSEMDQKIIEDNDDIADQRSDGTASPTEFSEITSPEEDTQLMKLEREESDRCLVLGRLFLQQAHAKFSTECGTKDIDIGSIPPEISEMSWKPSDDLMLMIYKAFMIDLGVLNDEKVVVETISNLSKDEKMTMREIIELEQALADSLKFGRAEIRNDPRHLIQIQSLQKRYPQMSMEAIEEAFISCNMDTKKTIDDLIQKGHTSFVVAQKKSIVGEESYEDDKGGGSGGACLVNNAIRIQRVNTRLEQEKERVQHVKKQLSLVRNTGGHKGQIEGYWKEEMRQSCQRLKWLIEQDGLATVAQRKKLYGSMQLDLHGLTCAAALSAIETRLEELRGRDKLSDFNSKDNSNHLMIICGRGLHSLHGQSRLKPVVRNYLTNCNIQFSQPFDGTYRISLRQLH